MPSLHFTSPFGNVKPPLLQALSIKRKKTQAAVAAAATVFKAFTSPRGKNILVRQGVKYRNMFHAGGGLVRERMPGEEVTPEKGWVTDEESEQSETEGGEDIIPVVEETDSGVERFEAEQETMEEAEILVVAVEEESAMDLIHEADEVAKTDLLKLELSLAEQEIPQVPVMELPTAQAKEVVEAPVAPTQETLFETPIVEVVEQETTVEALSKKVEQEIPEQTAVFLQQVEEQEPVPEVVAAFEEKTADMVSVIPEPQFEHVLEPSHPKASSLISVMNLLEPQEHEPVTLTAMMNVFEPSKPEPVPSIAVMEVVEPSMPEPSIPIPAAVLDTSDVQQSESLLKVKDTESTLLDDMPEIQEEQEGMKADEIEQQVETDIQRTVLEVDESKTFSEEFTAEDEVADILPNQIIGRESEVQEKVQETVQEPVPETLPKIEPALSPSIAEPKFEVPDEELKEEIVEKVLPICVQVISPQPPQETPVLAISEKHSEQLFDDEACEYDETELNEVEELDVEVQLENTELEGSLESTPSHMFKLALPLPSPTKSHSSSTVALCVKPEQTLFDLQKLIQLELPNALAGSQHISFTTMGIEPTDPTTDIPPKYDPTGLAIKDVEHAVLRRPSSVSTYGSRTTCTTRWSLSTEIGAFIGDAAKSQCFTINISPTADKPPSTSIRISLPSFNDRTLHLRSQLRTLASNLSPLSTLKSECDAAVQRAVDQRSIMSLAMSGFACLLLPLLLITFTYLSQPGLFPSFGNSPPRDLKLSHPVATYIAAGLADILLLAGFAYVWSAYRTTGRHSVPDLATVKTVYSERAFDFSKWEHLQAEDTRLRNEVRRVAAEYSVSWEDDEVEETKETGTAAIAA